MFFIKILIKTIFYLKFAGLQKIYTEKFLSAYKANNKFQFSLNL